MLLTSLAVLGLLGPATAFHRGMRPPTSALLFLEDNECLPENFEAGLPEAVRAAVEACRSRGRRGRSPEPRGHRLGGYGPGGHCGDMAAVLGCLAEQLDIISDSGVDEAALDALLESLSDDTAFTDQLKASADTCIAAINTTLTAEQQGVFVLACLKLSQSADCLRQTLNGSLCVNANTLIKCPIGILSFVDSEVSRDCSRGPLASVASDMSRGSFSAESFVDGVCPLLEQNARSVANCSLEAAGLANGGFIDLQAVQAAIEASASTSDAEKALQQEVLSTCQSIGTSTVEEFLDCFATEALAGCITSEAERLATAPTRGRPGGRCRGRGGRGRGGSDAGGRGRGGSGRGRGGMGGSG